MKQQLSRTLAKYQRSFATFTTGQKAMSLLGTGALLLAGFLVFQWAAAPSMAPLYSNLSSKDAAAVIDQLEASGTPYEIGGGGGTVMVPRDLVYSTRIDLSGEGLPTSGDDGYSLLDSQGLSTSQFQEQTDFKRAMEGELSRTVEAIDDVETAVVHLALPPRQVFADEQDPATASVLVATRAGTTLGAEQVQAVVHLVASSIDGLDPTKVTVADATGLVLSAPDGSASAAASTRTQQTEAMQQQLHGRLQAMLDRVVGVGNSTVQVTTDLDFDKSVIETTDFSVDDETPPLSSSSSSETYSGPDAQAQAGGVVGPDGQMDSTATGTGDSSSYEKTQTAEDNAVDSTVERRETSPGSIRSMHVSVVLDTATTKQISPADIQDLVAAGVGISRKRGDTVQVTSLPFDRTAELAAAAELEAAAAANAKTEQTALFRNIGLAVLVVLMLLLAWITGRRRAKARDKATTYVVEQLRQESTARTSALNMAPAALALEQSEHDQSLELREELNALVERQPEDVAALLRGWLVERP